MILGLLQQYLLKHNDVKSLTFISDRKNALIQAVADSYPDADHRYCFRHMYNNFKTYKSKGDSSACRAAEAYTDVEHDRSMEILEVVDEEAKEWLEKEPKKSWTRSKFPVGSKCDAVTNNFSKSFNAWILWCRDKPICKFVDKYTIGLFAMMCDRRVASTDMDDGGLVPSAMHVINKLAKKFNRYRIDGVSDHVVCAVNIKSDRKFNVDLAAHKCDCKVWDLTGIPCVHAVAVIMPRMESWIKYTSPYYIVDKLRATYAGYTSPIANEKNWGKLSEEERILPPPYTAAHPRGPKTFRLLEEHELEPTSSRRCSIARTCKALALEKGKAEASKLKKPKKNGGKSNEEARRQA